MSLLEIEKSLANKWEGGDGWKAVDRWEGMVMGTEEGKVSVYGGEDGEGEEEGFSPNSYFQLKRLQYRAYVSEFVCTFMFMALGLGLTAQVVLFGNIFDAYLAVWLNWALAVAFGFYIGGGISVISLHSGDLERV